MKSGISKIIIMYNYFCVMGYHRLLNAQVSRLPRQDIVPTTIFSVEYVISQIKLVCTIFFFITPIPPLLYFQNTPFIYWNTWRRHYKRCPVRDHLEGKTKTLSRSSYGAQIS